MSLQNFDIPFCSYFIAFATKSSSRCDSLCQSLWTESGVIFSKITQKLRNDSSPTGSEKQQEPKHMSVNAKLRKCGGPSETCICTTDGQETLTTYHDTSTRSRGNLVSLFLVASVACLETGSRTSAVIDLLKII